MSNTKITGPAGSRPRTPRLQATELGDAIAFSVQRALAARAEVSGAELQGNPPGWPPINGIIIHPWPPYPPINGIIIHPWPPYPPIINGIIIGPELGEQP